MRALTPAALLFVLAGCATPYVEERPGNPDDNVCTPCATAAQWNRPGDNPCPCPERADEGEDDAEGVPVP